MAYGVQKEIWDKIIVAKPKFICIGIIVIANNKANPIPEITSGITILILHFVLIYKDLYQCKIFGK